MQFIWKHGMGNMNSPTVEASIAAKKRVEGGNSNSKKMWTCPLLFETSCVCLLQKMPNPHLNLYTIQSVCLFSPAGVKGQPILTFYIPGSSVTAWVLSLAELLSSYFALAGHSLWVCWQRNASLCIPQQALSSSSSLLLRFPPCRNPWVCSLQSDVCS